MQKFNIIDFIYIVDLSLLNFIYYSDVIDNSYKINENGQLHLNMNTKNKKILAGFIINNINDHIQFGATNIIINTCKPMQNWRQDLRGNAIRSYKYKLIDNSIYIDNIKFNLFLDSIFNKLTNANLKNTSNYTVINNTEASIKICQNNFKCVQFENIDVTDVTKTLKSLLINLGSVNCNALNYNNIIINDGNNEYVHCSTCRDDIVETIRLNLLEKGII
jgi:hypothetical protein